MTPVEQLVYEWVMAMLFMSMTTFFLGMWIGNKQGYREGFGAGKRYDPRTDKTLWKTSA
jgi:hypothetical protein